MELCGAGTGVDQRPVWARLLDLGHGCRVVEVTAWAAELAGWQWPVRELMLRMQPVRSVVQEGPKGWTACSSYVPSLQPATDELGPYPSFWLSASEII